jgi:hypothetical protein
MIFERGDTCDFTFALSNCLYSFQIVLGISALVTVCVIAEIPHDGKKDLDEAASKKDKRTTSSYDSSSGHSGGFSLGGQHGGASLSYASPIAGLSLGHFPGLGLSSG